MWERIEIIVNKFDDDLSCGFVAVFWSEHNKFGRVEDRFALRAGREGPYFQQRRFLISIHSLKVHQ